MPSLRTDARGLSRVPRWCMKTGRMPRLTLPPAVNTQAPEPAAPALPARDPPPGPQRRLLAPAGSGRRRTRSPLRATRQPHRPPHRRRRHRRRGHPHRPAGSPAVPVSGTRRCPHAGIRRPASTCPTSAAEPHRGSSPTASPGQPMNVVSFQVHLRRIGVPPQRGRTSAIRQLVPPSPSPRHREGARPPRQGSHSPGY